MLEQVLLDDQVDVHEGSLGLLDVDSLWELLCRVYFYKDESRFVQETIQEKFAPSVREAEAVLNLMEKCKVGPVRDDTFGNELIQDVILRLGFYQNQEGLWEIDENVLLERSKAKDRHRHLFHSELAKLRYGGFREMMYKVAESCKQATTDLEGGEVSYTETEEMASSQREALRLYILEFQMKDGLLPFIVGLSKALQNQLLNEKNVCYFRFDDAAVVERGHVFAERSINLLLRDLRCSLYEDSPERTERTYKLDPQLSNPRIRRLLGLFPSHLRVENLPTSGSVGVLENTTRVNVSGEKDAKCPQDSEMW
eukprot:CAMPEP_0203753548 /NCGR_PEP_ID=MMETSP0098-20131031/7302_1 /ASSEMBLY_ACC=CAM_ASM_000208 /TAXON_ID=96639 /ORGANISM=" , Strain NY0313808BC1" /LENGTH=310 /DNA_ID=CAMNT_0050644195 /DNA_START=92 /DNA_END=1021 /DNA_ORIENTATION=+